MGEKRKKDEKQLHFIILFNSCFFSFILFEGKILNVVLNHPLAFPTCVYVCMRVCMTFDFGFFSCYWSAIVLATDGAIYNFILLQTIHKKSSEMKWKTRNWKCVWTPSALFRMIHKKCRACVVVIKVIGGNIHTYFFYVSRTVLLESTRIVQFFISNQV